MYASTQILKGAQAQMHTHTHMRILDTYKQNTLGLMPSCRGKAVKQALNPVGKFKYEINEPIKAPNSYT